VSALELLRAPARQSSALTETAHRPWPLPSGSWLMGQTWDGLLFAHWRVEAEAVRALVPPELSVDEHDGSAWLGITPFDLTGFRLRGTLPLPIVSCFPEINVRTYVTAEGKPGIWFFSLDTSSLIAVEAARRAYKLPYFHARIALDRDEDRIHYSSARRDAIRPFVFGATYEPVGMAFEPESGTLEHFLTERYCLYTEYGGELYRAEIHHPPWPLQPAEAEVRGNTMAPIALEGDPLVHYSERQDVVIWPLERT
jgi:uncharacterized protein YqjF (DUF2071 family)